MIVLQILLVAKEIAFGSYITIVSVGFLVTTLWLALTGVLGRRAGDKLPGGMGIDIFAGLYFATHYGPSGLGKSCWRKRAKSARFTQKR